MTIGSDLLDAWGKTLIEADELYRELQLLIRINPEAYNVDSTALAAVGVANADAYDDGGMDHPIAFARRWAWHLAAENKSIPPITNAWVPLVRYVSAHLQYLGRDDQEEFGTELRRLRGLLGALVNENGLSRGEEEALTALNARDARKALREWALTSDATMKRKDLAHAFPTLTDREWTRLRVRKHRSAEDIPAYHYPVRWVAEIAPDEDSSPLPIEAQAPKSKREDVYDDSSRIVSLDALNESKVVYGNLDMRFTPRGDRWLGQSDRAGVTGNAY